MPIDNCRYSYEQLTKTVLPKHYKALELAMKSPTVATALVGPKSVTRGLLQTLGREADFPGCYVFIHRGKPEYVGISRGVLKRLVQHLNYESHYSASLVYRMATEDYPHEMKRDQAMKDEQFKAAFLSAQDRLRQMTIAWVQIDNDLELYLFEVFAAMKLHTETWNTFRTH